MKPRAINTIKTGNVRTIFLPVDRKAASYRVYVCVSLLAEQQKKKNSAIDFFVDLKFNIFT